MKNSHRFMIGTLTCWILFTVSPVLAEDWPQWRGPNRDAKVSGFTAPKEWPHGVSVTQVPGAPLAVQPYPLARDENGVMRPTQ